MKKVLVAIFATLFIFGVSGCSSDSYDSADYSRICIDQDTQERVDGTNCGNDDHTAANGFLWWYVLYGHALPGYGSPVVGGYRSVRKSAIIEHDEYLAPTGGSNYTTAPKRAYSNGSGKKLGTVKGGQGYKAPSGSGPKLNNPPKAPAGKAPQSGYKAPAPAVRPPAPAPRPVAPAPRAPAPIRIK